jgi:hypothetical protein
METCGNTLTCVASIAPSLLDALFAVVTAASAIAAVTQTPSDDKWVGKLYRIVDLLALNFGYAKDLPKRQGGRFVPN